MKIMKEFIYTGKSLYKHLHKANMGQHALEGAYSHINQGKYGSMHWKEFIYTFAKVKCDSMHWKELTHTFAGGKCVFLIEGAHAHICQSKCST